MGLRRWKERVVVVAAVAVVVPSVAELGQEYLQDHLQSLGLQWQIGEWYPRQIPTDCASKLKALVGERPRRYW